MDKQMDSLKTFSGGYHWCGGTKTHARVFNTQQHPPTPPPTPSLIRNAEQKRARNSERRALTNISEIKYHMLYNMYPQKIKEKMRAKESTREIKDRKDKVCTVKIILCMEKQ